ncbi:hypothetical protein [uncultured Slackia sp.]|uniref:hypothetical protein n=1 Tax=uncultured Slackia sp. TaxID=665903 RepID=UPI0026E053BF|nr:hypothetical protein [uncultured Slackia sp.]
MSARIRRRACVWAAAFVLGVTLCAPAASAAEGDGSSQGSVVSAGAEAPEGKAPDAEHAGPADPEGQLDAVEPEEAPTPLDAAGNEVNDGQVSDTSFLYDAAIADLAGADSYYNGQTVQVRGEAVGEAIRMADGSSDLVWVTLADVASNSSVSVVMRREDAAGIDTYGAYGKTGSWLRVQGVFNLACSEHEGESDIHATSVVVEDQGFEHPDEFDIHAFFPAFVALTAGAFLMLMFWYVRERSR